MSNLKTLIALTLVLTPLAACGEEPACPAGSERRGGACIQSDASPAQAADAGWAPDGGRDADAAADGGTECAPKTLVYIDVDEDGVGAGEGVEGCPGLGFVMAGGDCSPENPDVYPGNLELCNGTDDDCDGNIDEGVAVRLYPDADEDGHGDASDPGELVCTGEAVEGRVASHDDCDDQCDTCTPDNDLETACDGKDDDCNAQIDDGVLTPFLLDCDGDHYLANASEQVMELACSSPVLPESCSGGVWRRPGDMAAGIDCNDHEARSRPGAPEVCDGIDNDCDSQKDEGLATARYYADCDGDGQRRRAGGQTVCGPDAVISPVCDRSRYGTASQFHLYDCADDDMRAHWNAIFVADEHGISGAHRTSNLDEQDFDCDGAVELFPNYPRCSGDMCDCYLDQPRCGRTVRLRLTNTAGPGGNPFCQLREADVGCR